MNRREFLEKAAREYKIARLRANPMLDEVAIKLNAQPTYDEQRHVEHLWGIFEKLGAKAPEPPPTKVINPRDQRRLQDGAAALALPYPTSEDEIRSQISQLHDAICALQSLDDLGSEEANRKAWNDMETLQDRHRGLQRRLRSIEEHRAQRHDRD